MEKGILKITILVLLLSVLIVGCRDASRSIDRNNIKDWLAEDPDSCLWYYTDQYVPLLKKKRYADIEQLYARILRDMPAHPKQNKNVNYLVGWVLTFYHNALMLQNKLKGSESLTDSLLRSSHPYYTQIMRPELLSASVKMYQMQNKIKQVDSLSKLFLSIPPTDDPRRDARVWHKTAWALEFIDIDPALPMRLMEHAMESCHKVEGKVGNEGEIYSYMGYLYWKNGKFEKATSAIQEGIDWYISHPDTPGDGLIEACNNLSRVYLSLGLYDRAIEANNRAVGVSKAMDNWMLEDVYYMRAVCFSKAARPDSALYWVDEAMKVTPEIVDEYFIPELLVSRLGYFYELYPDSIGSKLEECKSLLKDTLIIDPVSKNNLLTYYGMALLHAPGETRKGIAYMERSYYEYLSGHHPEGIIYSGEQLIRCYIEAGMSERIADIYPSYAEVRDSLKHQMAVNSAIGANIRYETGRKEQENRALIAEISLKQHTLTFMWVLVVLLVILLTGGGLYVRQRRNYHRRVSEARLSQISGLLRVQQELSLHNDKLKQQLQTVTELKTISDIRVQISTDLFNSDKEADFRRNFTALYPAYLPALHRMNPDITRTDELIAMLLLLDLSSDEVALTLGISRNGVNKARSRMRKRLGLDKEVKLEEFLKGILN